MLTGLNELMAEWKLFFRVIFARLTTTVACSLSSGAIAVFLSGSTGMSPAVRFFLGAVIPMGPLYLFYSSPWAMRRQFESWKKTKEDGLITDAQYKRIRQALVDWYVEKWFGQASLGKVDEETEPT